MSETSSDDKYYVLPKAFLGYEEGFPLRNVSLKEARSWECNRCGDCCSGLREGVKKDEGTGLPLLVWGSKFPEDLYEARYHGQRLIIPIVLGDGGPDLGEAFEIDSTGKPYTAFACSFLEEASAAEIEAGIPETTCGLIKEHGEGDPADISTIRPRNCGEFPVFGRDIDASLIDGNPFVPPTGALPRCVWYGIRITGPWKDTPYWRERWNSQQRGEPVAPSIAPDPQFIEQLLARRETVDGSVRNQREGD